MVAAEAAEIQVQVAMEEVALVLLVAPLTGQLAPAAEPVVVMQAQAVAPAALEKLSSVKLQLLSQQLQPEQ
jgi:hypothetical protein